MTDYQLSPALKRVLDGIGQDVQERMAQDIQEDSTYFAHEIKPPVSQEVVDLAQAILDYMGMAEKYPLSDNWRNVT